MTDFSESIIGFDKNLKLIEQNFFNKSLSNSLIFYGNKGIGKKTFTYFLINNIYRELIKKSRESNFAKLIYNNSHPNIRILEKNFDTTTKKVKNNITIDQIRDLHKFIYQHSFDNLPKFIIIDSADDLNKSSSNALLKILEEPTINTFIVLISHQLSSLLPTIRSRCIKFNFQNPNKESFKKIILNQYNDMDNLDFLYDLSNGSPGMAINLIEGNINEVFYNLIDIVKESKPLSPKIINLSNEVSKYTNDQFKILVSMIKFILINISKINLGININNSFVSNMSNLLYESSKDMNNLFVFKILEYLNNYEKNLYVYNLDKRLFILNTFSILKNS